MGRQDFLLVTEYFHTVYCYFYSSERSEHLSHLCLHPPAPPPSAAVLVLYFKYFLRWDDDFATTIYHTFAALCYLMPILGAIVADSWLGKFK